MGYIIHKDKISFGRQHIQVITVLVCTAIIVLYAAVRNVETFYWDCNFYWNSADGMLQNGIFDLYSFPNTFRGYFFPTVLLLLKMAGRMLFSSDFFLFRFFMALLVSITIGVVIPVRWYYPICLGIFYSVSSF